jgi:hypothetical protein
MEGKESGKGFLVLVCGGAEMYSIRPVLAEHSQREPGVTM